MEDILRRQVAAPRTASASYLINRVAGRGSRVHDASGAAPASGPALADTSRWARDHHTTMMGIDRAGAPFIGGALLLAAVAAWLGSAWWWAIPFVLLAGVPGLLLPRSRARHRRRRAGGAVAGRRPRDGGRARASRRSPRRAPGSRSASSCRRWTSTSTASPYGGTLTRVTYQPGKFLPAYRDESGAQNERTELWVERDGRTVVFRQVVGVLARRVVCRVREGETVKPASASA